MFLSHELCLLEEAGEQDVVRSHRDDALTIALHVQEVPNRALLSSSDPITGHKSQP